MYEMRECCMWSKDAERVVKTCRKRFTDHLAKWRSIWTVATIAVGCIGVASFTPIKFKSTSYSLC